MALTVLDGNGVARTVKTTLDGSDHVTHHKIDSVAGTVAATQSGTWNVGLTGTVPAITPGTGATNLGKGEDGGHTTGDVGVMALAVRNDTPTVLADADKDYHALTVDSTGRLHANAIRSGDGIHVDASVLTVKRAFGSIAVGTDTSVIAAVASKKLRVLAVVLTAAGPATIVFNTKPGGAGTAISATFNLATGTGANTLILPPEVCGWFETFSGEGLSATVVTNAVNVHILYAEV